MQYLLSNSPAVLPAPEDPGPKKCSVVHVFMRYFCDVCHIAPPSWGQIPALAPGPLHHPGSYDGLTPDTPRVGYIRQPLRPMVHWLSKLGRATPARGTHTAIHPKWHYCDDLTPQRPAMAPCVPTTRRLHQPNGTALDIHKVQASITICSHSLYISPLGATPHLTRLTSTDPTF